MTKPRIGLAGILLESNRFAPVATEDDFRNMIYLEGDEILKRARAPASVLPKEMSAFVQAMDATGDWQPVPLLLTACPPWGPVDQEFFGRCLNRIDDMIDEAGPLDGIYLCNHGAMVATRDHDPDGTLFRRLRDKLGDDAGLFVTLDLHANISPTMVDAADGIIGYRTNPHVDQWSRGEEAAFAMRLHLAGMRPQCVLVRLPLTPPSVTLLTEAGPYADMIQYGQRRRQELADEILNVSVFGGFAFSDTPENGVATVVTAREHKAAAIQLANEIAAFGWANRERYRRNLTSIGAAVELARTNAEDPKRAAVIFSDAGDNPGGGGEGRTTWLLSALSQDQAKGVYFGSFFDPTLARIAHDAGVGAAIEATFNSDFESEFSKPFSAPARVLALHDGEIVGRLGIFAGRALELGPCAALEIGGPDGIKVVVISRRHQTADPMFFEMFGFDIADARTICVKSRGHFRAGFRPWFGPEQVYEVDTAGLTAPVLNRFNWQYLPRPVFPLDDNAEWSSAES
jgi:microcystin degradation protein MlrC